LPLDWAMTETSLGAALAAIGVRERNADRLREAVSAYRSALLVLTRDAAPLQWARTQLNLGVTLWALGTQDGGSQDLQAATTALDAALLVWTRERAPDEWTTATQAQQAARAQLASASHRAGAP